MSIERRPARPQWFQKPSGLFPVCLMLLPAIAPAQQDTAYYKSYPDLLGIGIFEAIRNNEIVFEKKDLQFETLPSSVRYSTNGRALTGFVFNYDKIFLSFGFKTANAEEAIKGKSKNTNLLLQLRGRKLILEASYRKYTGFYESKAGEYNASFTDSIPYYINPGMSSRNIKIKALYFTNHNKFSYNASYFGSFRQIKSAASWIINGNVYFSNVLSENALIPYYASDVFEKYAALNKIKVNGFSFGGGGAANLVVFKRFFFNVTATLAAEPQWRTYGYTDGSVENPFYVSLAVDARSAFGYNSKRFWIIITGVNDLTFNNNKSLNITGNFFTSTISLGYRFGFENNFTRALKNNKVYKSI